MSTTLNDLRKEADDLGIVYGKTTGERALEEKINAFYKAQETSVMQVPDDTAEQDDVDTNAPKRPSAKERANLTRIQREEAARKIRVVTIIDNDQRVNNQTTTCTVNCSNEFFDLGTVVLPLNERIEVQMGHIKTLQQVQIPLHMRDSRTGLSTVRVRPRYTVTMV